MYGNEILKFVESVAIELDKAQNQAVEGTKD
jgi:hypothetical protein